MKSKELGRVYLDNENIFREGDQGDCMYVIQSGKVRISKDTPEGEITITHLGRGEIFGEMALFDRLPRSAHATALGEAQVLSVDKRKLFTSINRDTTMVFKLIETMSGRIRTLNEDLSALRDRTSLLEQGCLSLDRLYLFILDEVEKIISAESGSIMMLDEEDRLIIKAAFGTEMTTKTPLSKGHGIAGSVVKSGRAEMVNNVAVDSRYIPGEQPINAVICAPLGCLDYSFGCLNMSNHSNRVFSSEDLKMLQAVAMYASIAIQNAREYSDLRKSWEETLTRAQMLDMARTVTTDD